MKHKFVTVCSILLLVVLTTTSCTFRTDFNRKLHTIVKPYSFSYVKWEAGAIGDEIREAVTGETLPADDSDTVIKYFETLKARQETSASGIPLADLRTQAEAILERQIRQVLRQQGISNPFGNFLSRKFPPVDFKLSQPPHLLVISPRDRIERTDEALLVPDLTVGEMESIESQVAALGVSALVVELGGTGVTFPTFVNTDADLSFIINSATEEWLHQYLTFTPLGFRYFLDLIGLVRNDDIVTVNETVAGMVSDEIGALVYEQYYAGYEPAPATGDTAPAFDFNREMREIRRTVDSYLAQGEIATAEQYMEDKRQFLLTKGYYIRKLNQAYFAFHGSYADEPTSIDPIGEKLKVIRGDYTTVKEFLDTVSRVTDAGELDSLR